MLLVQKTNKWLAIAYITVSAFFILSYLGFLLVFILSKISDSTWINSLNVWFTAILWTPPIAYMIVFIIVGMMACGLVLLWLQFDYQKQQFNKWKTLLIIPTLLGVVYAIPAWIMLFIYLHFALKQQRVGPNTANQNTEHEGTMLK